MYELSGTFPDERVDVAGYELPGPPQERDAAQRDAPGIVPPDYRAVFDATGDPLPAERQEAVVEPDGIERVLPITTAQAIASLERADTFTYTKNRPREEVGFSVKVDLSNVDPATLEEPRAINEPPVTPPA